MKLTLRIFTLILGLTLILSFTACGGERPNRSSSTESSKNVSLINDNLSHNTSSVVSDISNSSDSQSSDDSSDSSDEMYEMYTIHDISDYLITVTETKKIFNNTRVNFSLPLDWKCLGLYGEDVTLYYFRDPVLDEDCQLLVKLTFIDYFTKYRTEDEYLEYLSDIHEQDIAIDTYVKEKIDGFDGVKVAYSFNKNGTKFNAIRYDDIVVGFGLYDFEIVYPSEKKDKYESIFESILDSIKFTPTEYS